MDIQFRSPGPGGVCPVTPVLRILARRTSRPAIGLRREMLIVRRPLALVKNGHATQREQTSCDQYGAARFGCRVYRGPRVCHWATIFFAVCVAIFTWILVVGILCVDRYGGWNR